MLQTSDLDYCTLSIVHLYSLVPRLLGRGGGEGRKREPGIGSKKRWLLEEKSPDF